jgi:hypothetical protein
MIYDDESEYDNENAFDVHRWLIIYPYLEPESFEVIQARLGVAI